MKALIFAKKRKTSEGKEFYGYIATLTKKDGSEETIGCKFKEECGNPKPDSCPLYIEFDKDGGNISTKHETVVNEVGEESKVERKTLWISKYIISEEKYVDTSLDDYE